MVKQDHQTTLALAAERIQRQEEQQIAAAEQESKAAKKARGGWQLLAVQSIACVVILLLAVFVRVGGGSLYEQLRQSFGDALMRNDLAAVLAGLWDGNPLDALSSDPLGMDGEGTQTQSTTTTQAGATSTTTTTSTTAAGVSYTGRLPPQGASAVAICVNHPAMLPLAKGVLTSRYGYRDNPTAAGEQFHRGIDIAAPQGTRLAAMYYARVTAVGESAGLGHYICLTSGDVEILYAHCAEILASEGAIVRAGETVALVGATGDATGSHVHIAVSVDGVTYNPSGIVPVSCYA